MPAGARAPSDAVVLRNKEQEWKRSRGAIACAECRRLKLKCDKSVPCTSCRRRGCASICPNGSLVTGQGTRFVLADTDRLHNKITDMSDRIRQLEDALALSHGHVSRDAHPLLQRDLLKVKSIIDLHAAVDQEGGDSSRSSEPPGEGDESQSLDVFGTLAIRDDGASTFYGRSAGQESILLGERDAVEDSPSPPDPSRPSTAGTPTGLPYAIIEIARAFPDASVRLPLDALEAYLPHWERAAQLCALYLNQAPWFFGAVRARQLHEEILPMFYPEAATPPQSTSQPQSTPQLTSTPHDLGLLFVILCFGAATDESLPPAPTNTEADMYYLLTKAALALDPVMDRAPTVSTVQALSLMAIYQGLVANEHSIESTWALMGLATKLAQSVNRDCARWKLSPAEVQKRRSLFWELFITDCWQSLATGRIATFSIPVTDCELPQDTDGTLAADGTPQESFPFWKARFGRECVADVVAGILTARPPKYSIIIELDRKIRDMEVPKYAVDAPPEGAPFGIAMQHYMPINYRHLTLLYIHRTFLAQGLCDHPYDPLRSQYAPSILAGYRSACQILSNLRDGFAQFPTPIARFWVLWTHAFSAAVMLALIPVRAPQSKMAHTALLELQMANDLFERAVPYGGRAVKMQPIVRRHLDKALQSFQVARSEGIPRGPESIFPRPSRDEFSVFSGVTSTVSAPARPQPARLQVRGAGGEVHSGLPSAAPADTDTDMAVDQRQRRAEWGHAHATLVDQLVTFEGSLDAQINRGGWEVGGGGQAPQLAQSQSEGSLQYPRSDMTASSSEHSPAAQHPGNHEYQRTYPYAEQQHQEFSTHLHHTRGEQLPSHPHPQQQPSYLASHPQEHSHPTHPTLSHRSSSHNMQAYLPPPQPHYYAPPHTYHAPTPDSYQHHQQPALPLPPQQTPQLHYSEGSSPASSTLASTSSELEYPATPDPQAQQKLWNVPHTEADVLARPRSPRPRALDRVLRQSGDLSLTEAWSAFMSQMDVSMPPRR
ncbi:hypothetical protein FA95DRAFT_1588235 [Auriscalpium vulgare]|uniref:Uncharacterized protein n=1 Tax=Auriscalpium vulgare TaxID=40419 RepID=A0ACB8S071_9AGAM|nr:hypothetical protein FA95DRAFT_1588235 [Auriscalpium vulgare]